MFEKDLSLGVLGALYLAYVVSIVEGLDLATPDISCVLVGLDLAPPEISCWLVGLDLAPPDISWVFM